MKARHASGVSVSSAMSEGNEQDVRAEDGYQGPGIDVRCYNYLGLCHQTVGYAGVVHH
jgi:hypothetical protein